MSERKTNLQFPLAGLERRSNYQSQPPYFTPACVNVRSEVSGTGRLRGGMRPGLGYALWPTGLATASPVRMMGAVQLSVSDDVQSWSDSFHGNQYGLAWTLGQYAGGGTPRLAWGDYATVDPSGNGGYAYRTAQAMKTGAGTEYRIELFIAPGVGGVWGKYQLIARMNDATPDHATDAILAEITMPGLSGNANVKISKVVAGVTTALDNQNVAMSYPEAGWFTLRVVNNDVYALWRGVQKATAAAVGAPAGSRFGFGLVPSGQGSYQHLADTFRIQYKATYSAQQKPTRVRNRLVVSAGGNIYDESAFYNELNAIATTRKLASDRRLECQQRLGKLYVADTGDPLYTGTAGVRGTGADRFDDAGVADWTTLGISPKEDYVLQVITPGVGQLAGVYEITNVAAGELTLSDAWDGGGGGTTTLYQIIRSPKIYDPAAATLTNWRVPFASMANGANIVPLGCSLIAMYRDRMVLAGGNQWYMSRQGNPLDWKYGDPDDDVQRAVSAATSQAGVIAEDLTALISGGDDYLIFGCQRSLWVLRGEVTLGGVIDNISYEVGVCAPGAWCKGPGGEIWFLSRDGLYRLPAQASGRPESISRSRLPDELVNLGPSSGTVSMAYDTADQLVHIYVVGETTNSRKHFHFDVENGAFWPVQIGLPSSQEPTAIIGHAADNPEDACVLLGTKGGHVMRFHRNYPGDEGGGGFAYVCIGPFAAWSADRDGILASLAITLASRLGRCDLDIYGAETADAVAQKVVDGPLSSSVPWNWNGTDLTLSLAAGLNPSWNPRIRGPALLLKLRKSFTPGAPDDYAPFAFDGAVVRLEEAGPVRKTS